MNEARAAGADPAAERDPQCRRLLGFVAAEEEAMRARSNDRRGGRTAGGGGSIARFFDRGAGAWMADPALEGRIVDLTAVDADGVSTSPPPATGSVDESGPAAAGICGRDAPAPAVSAPMHVR